MRMLLVRLLAVVLSGTLFAGCAGQQTRSDVREYLDKETGATVTRVKDPATFVHEVPGLASSGRDYVYLAPLAINSGGARTYWVWLGIWSTVDRQARDERASPLSIGPLLILADDEPIELNLQSANSNPNPTGIRMPYATPVTTNQTYLARVTRSQLQRLGHARVLTLTDSPAGGLPRTWRDDGRTAAMLGRFSE
jgi:hypothetical protein